MKDGTRIFPLTWRSSTSFPLTTCIACFMLKRDLSLPRKMICKGYLGLDFSWVISLKRAQASFKPEAKTPPASLSQLEREICAFCAQSTPEAFGSQSTVADPRGFGQREALRQSDKTARCAKARLVQGLPGTDGPHPGPTLSVQKHLPTATAKRRYSVIVFATAQ